MTIPTELITYKPQHFRPWDLVHPSIWNFHGESVLYLLDPRMLWTLDRLREQFGEIIINNWHSGGFRMKSGLYQTETPTSHSLGRGFDLVFSEYFPETIRENMKQFPRDEIFQYITRCGGKERQWLHIDNMNTLEERIVFI